MTEYENVFYVPGHQEATILLVQPLKPSSIGVEKPY